MSFIEEIKALENDRNSKENMALNDIVYYFTKKMNSELFKKNLKENYIKRAINEGKNSCDLHIEFWEYCSGCSPTYIRVYGCGKFEIIGKEDNYDSYYNYMGVRLSEIHKRVCSKISEVYKQKLEELGLKVLHSEREDSKYRFNYYKERITISW